MSKIKGKKERILSLILSLVVLLALLPVGRITVLASESGFAGGDGSPEAPYQIATAAQLDAVRNNLTASYILINDIDLTTACQSGGSLYDGGAGWNPIGKWSESGDTAFRGTLDGNGHTITGLFINRTANDVGLFGCIFTQGAVQNLTLKDVSVTSDRTVGSLAGVNSGTVTGCGVLGSSSVKANVQTAGGLIGNNGGTVTNNYALCKVDSTGIYGGGLVGYSGGNLTNCYAAGSVSGSTSIGGLLGWKAGGAVTNCYYNKEVSGQSDTGKGAGLTTLQMLRPAGFSGFDFTNIWTIQPGVTYPYLRSATSSVHPAPAPGITVGSQSGTLRAGLGGTATFEVTVIGAADDAYMMTPWSKDGLIGVSAPAGLSVDCSELLNNTATVTVTADELAEGGEYYFVVICKGMYSAETPVAVYTASDYTISLSQNDAYAFPTQGSGYPPVPALNVTVENKGLQATGDLTVALGGANPGSFTLSRNTISSVAASGSDSFNVAPKTGLTMGTYAATVTVSGEHDIAASFDVSFTVDDWAVDDVAITIFDGFSFPNGVAVDGYGNIYVADFDNNKVKKMNPDGNTITLGSDFLNPRGIALDGSGNIYVADTDNDAVKKMDANGSHIVTLGSEFSRPWDIAVDGSGNIYVADTWNNAVKRMDADGSRIVTLGDGFSAPSGVALDSSGNIYVADTENSSIKKMSADGSKIVKLGSDSEFSRPCGIAVDGSGNIYVADTEHHAIKKMSADGSEIMTLGSGFKFPHGIAVDDSGNISVADTYNGAVKKIQVRYTVTYHANGGTGTAPTEGGKASGATFAAAANSFTAPSGKKFKEWNTAYNGTGTSYAVGATVTMPSGSLTLYAIWEEPTAPTLTGPTAMTLAEGYSATSTDAYTITGTAPVTVTKTSGDAKITWNDTDKKLEIAAGLTAGSYPVVLKASNGALPDAAPTFTLTVTEFAGGDGSSGNPYQIATAAQLNNVRNHLNAHFELANDIDLTDYLSPGGAGYNGGKGWAPIHRYVASTYTDYPFTGTFDGKHHVISGLMINNSDENDDQIGLFGTAGTGCVIRDLNIAVSSIQTKSEYVGALVGWACGESDDTIDISVTNCHATGGLISGDSYVGGLVGDTMNGVAITRCSSSCAVSAAPAGTLKDACVGGLVGQTDYQDSISQSYSTGAVASSNGNYVGGLVGHACGSISNCYATGVVSGKGSVGGLIGASLLYGDLTITNCYATGAVSGQGSVGGLVGANASSYNALTIQMCYARGPVTGTSNVGGLIGSSGPCSVTNCYAVGPVTGTGKVGGLIGSYGSGSVNKCYAAGAVIGTGSNFGGLIGSGSATVSSSFYNGPVSGRSGGKGTSKTSSEMVLQSTYTGAGWDFTPVSGVWGINAGQSYPYLLAVQSDPLPTPPTLVISGSFTANSKAYDGGTAAAIQTNGLTLSGVESGDAVTLSAAAAFADKNVGTGKTVSLTSACSLSGTKATKYVLSLTGAPTATADITAKTLTVGGSFTANSKLYDETNTATFQSNNLTLTGVISGDTVTLNAAAAFADENPGTGKKVSLTSSSFLAGADAGNYTLSLTGAPTATADITLPAAPKITGPVELTLTEGYSAASTDVYTITGSATVTVTKTSGDSRITWNDAAKKLDIATGLTAGSYPVVLAASNGTLPDATLTFTLTVTAMPKVGLEIITEGSGVVKMNGTELASGYSGLQTRGTSIDLTAEPNAGNTFVYWQDTRSGSILSTDSTYKFLMGTSISLTAVFNRNLDTTATTFTVTFKDKNGKILQSATVAKGEAAAPPASPSLPGYRFTGWDKTFDNVTSDMTISALYQRLPATYTLTVVGGTLSAGGTSGSFQYDMPVTVVAGTAPSGQKFSHWQQDGVKVSTSSSYSFYTLMQDTTLTAVFVAEDTVLVNTPLIFLSTDVQVDTADKKIQFIASRSVPAEYTLIESGILLLQSTTLTGELTIDTAGVIPGRIKNDSTDQFYISKSNIHTGETWYGRAYLMYRDANGNIVTVYSDNTEKRTMN